MIFLGEHYEAMNFRTSLNRHVLLLNALGHVSVFVYVYRDMNPTHWAGSRVH